MAATVAIGSQNQYVSTVSGGTVPTDLHIRDVPDWVDKLERTDVPLQKMIGSEGPPSMPMNKAEWGWGSPDPYADALNGAISSAGATSITVDNGEYFQIGDRILVNSEEMRVEGRAGDVLTVERGFAGTTATTHSKDDAVYILGPAVVESADDADSPFTQGEVDFNYHQIMTFTWSMSHRRQVTPTYEGKRRDNFAAELRKKMEFTAPVRFELTLLLGQRALGTSTSPSAMGGLRQSSFITTRNNLSSAILTEYDLMSGLQTVSNLVGSGLMPDTILCSHFTARVISSWYNETRRSSMSDSKAKVNFTSIETDFGTFKVTPHYLMDTVAPDKLYVLEPNRLKKRPYASGTGWQTGEHETQGWHRRGFLRADQTLLAPYCDARLEIYGYSTTASAYSGLA